MLEDGVLGPESRKAYVKLYELSTQQCSNYVAYAPAPTRKAPAVHWRRPSKPSYTISEKGDIVVTSECELKQPHVRQLIPRADHVLSEKTEKDIISGRYDGVIERGSTLPDIDAALDRQIQHATNPARFGLVQETKIPDAVRSVLPRSLIPNSIRNR
jgi:hypothetical protein